MKVKAVSILTRVIVLSLITVSIMYGSGIVELSDHTDTSSQTTYSNMSTTQLQIQVEKLSQKGELPFPMGMELIQRWTQK